LTGSGLEVSYLGYTASDNMSAQSTPANIQ